MNIETSNPLWFIAFQPPTLQPTSTIPPAVPRPQRSIARAQVQRVLCSVVKSTPSLFSWTFESIFDQNLWLFLWKLALCGTTSSLNQFEVIFTPKHHLCYPPVSSATENTLWMEVLVGKKIHHHFSSLNPMGNRDSNDSAGAFQRSNRHRVIASFGPRPRPRLPVGRCPFSFLLDATNDMLLPDKGNVPGYAISVCIYI